MQAYTVEVQKSGLALVIYINADTAVRAKAIAEFGQFEVTEIRESTPSDIEHMKESPISFITVH